MPGGKNWKSALLCLKSSMKIPHRNQEVSESVHDAELAKKYFSNCNVCVEESKLCNCKADEDLLGVTVIDTKDGGELHVNANSSFVHSVINMVGMLVGLGQLSTPYALQNGGWASAFLLVGLGVACGYTSHILGKCLKGKAKSRNYSDIGSHAFGAKGRVIATTFNYMGIFMALVSFTISLSDNLTTVFARTHLKFPCVHLSTTQILTVIAVLVALPSLWLRDLSSISFLSFGGILTSLLIFTTVAITAISGAVKANHNIPFLQLHNIPAISGLYIFGFAGHMVFPDIYKSMKDPSKFTKVSIVSFSIVTALYTSLAFMGATMFGPGVNSQITLSMPQHLIVTKIALWATVLTPMTKYALQFAPIAMQLEHALPYTLSSRMRMFIRGTVGSLLLIGILGLALSIPYFQYVLSLTGSVVCIAISIIFPCAFYVKIYWQEISKPALVLNVALMLIGFLSGVFGTISSSKSLFQSIQKGPLP